MDPIDDLSKIRHVQPGDPVAAKPTSQPTRALELRLQRLEELVSSLSQFSQFSKFVIQGVPIKTGDNAVVMDDVVYYNANSGLYEKAIAGVTIVSGVFESNPTALALGVCVNVSGAFGDIMIAGYDTWRGDDHKAHMLEPNETFISGVPYFLSATDLGKLTRFPPAIQIQIMIATDQHYVLETKYGIPDTTDNPTKQAIGMRPMGGIRKNPTSYGQYVVVGFDALELVTPDLSHDGYGVWQATDVSATALYKQLGYMVADANITIQPSFPVYVRISVDTSGNIKACQATSLAHLDWDDGAAYNKVTGFVPQGTSASLVRTYSLMDGDAHTQIGLLSFNFTGVDHTYRRDVIFKIPDSFQGWKMINPPLQAAGTVVVSGGKVISITMDQPSLGYDIPPVLVITGDGTGATAVAVLDNFGSITRVDITNQGTGYTSAMVAFSRQVSGVAVLNAGMGAAATATQTGGAISTVTVTSPGSGYVLPPSAIVIDDSPGMPGTGAVLNPVVTNGLLTHIDVLQPGAGYVNPVVIIKPAANRGYHVTRGATFNVTVASGVITAVTVVDPGFGIPVGATLNITDSPAPTTPAVLVLHVDEDGQAVSVDVTSGGTGYTAPVITTVGVSNPTFVQADLLSFTGTPATANVNLSPMSVERVDILCGGASYGSTSTVAFSAPTGASPVTATGRLKIDVDGHISDVIITNPGNGYLEPPTVTITDSGSNGNNAVLEARISAIVSSVAVTSPGDQYDAVPVVYAGTPVDHIEMDDYGSDYSSTPGVTIGPPDDEVSGVQATAIALLGQQISEANITNGGSGYTTPNNWQITVSGGGGTGAVLIPIFVGGILVDVQVVQPGYGYTGVPVVALAPITGSPPGSGATMIAIMEGVGSVVAVQLTNAGSGYGKPPAITIDPPGGIGLRARASAKMIGTGAALRPAVTGLGGIQSPIPLQIFDFQQDLADNISSPLAKPVQGIFYYNIKADPRLKAKYPSIPPERSLFIMNGTELVGTIYNEETNLSADVDADVIFCRKSPIWTTFDVNGCPWDAEYRAYVVDFATSGVDCIIPKSGPWNFQDSWFRWWEHVFRYEVNRNKAWIHLNRGSRFYQTGRVLSLGVLSPFRMFDVATGTEVQNDGSPMTGQLLLTFEGEAPFLTGSTGAQLDLTQSNALVAIYTNNTSRPVMVSSVVLLVTYQTNRGPLTSAADTARVTVGTQAGGYRDIIGTIDPTVVDQQGMPTQLYAQSQVKEMFPDDRDSAPLILPGQQVFMRVDSATSGNILTQLVSARVRGYLF